MIQSCLFLLAGIYTLQLSSFAGLATVFVVAVAATAGRASRHIKVAAICCAAGIVLFASAALHVIDSRLAPEFAGDSMLVQIRIIDFPRMRAATATFMAEPIAETIAEPIEDRRIPEKIRLSWFEPPVTPRLGDVWQVELRLKRPRGNSNPAVFDFEAWMFRQEIAATGYVVGANRNILLRSALTGRDQFRQRFVDRLTGLVSGEDTAAVLAAIGVGARHLVSAEQWDRYARTGTSHLMAISGLHIGLAASVAYMFVLVVSGVFRMPGNHHSLALLAAVAVAVFYAYVSGFDVPARRATLMIILLTGTAIWRRQTSPTLVLCAACVVIVISHPLASMAPGFKLSFGAVLLLIWIAARHSAAARRGSWPQRGLYAIRSLAGLQILLLFGLLPLTVIIFQRVALAAPLVNLIAVPVFSIVTVPMTFAGLVLDGPLQPFGDLALLVAAGSVEMLERGITSAASVEAASVSLPAVSGFAWLIVMLPLLLVVLPPGWPGRYLAWLALVALLLHKPAGPKSDCVHLEILDVGQGLATVIRTSEHVALFDTGPAFRQGSSMAQRVVLPYLMSIGVDMIDRIIVSHADLDHAGGLTDLLADIVVDETLTGEPMFIDDSRTLPCVAASGWRWDGIEFRFINPPSGVQVDGNDASCVLVINAGPHSVVLTGDIEQSVERRLVRDGTISRADVVVVPHHGSRTSSTAAFVRSLSPSLAIVSAGFENRWGFPKAEVVARWESSGAKVLNTATSGAIAIRMCTRSGIVSVTEHRPAQHRIFHER
jgi:competence protein ComEC